MTPHDVEFGEAGRLAYRPVVARRLEKTER
jgi:hypothetical protein